MRYIVEKAHGDALRDDRRFESTKKFGLKEKHGRIAKRHKWRFGENSDDRTLRNTLG
jgi:hypothetical protein